METDCEICSKRFFEFLLFLNDSDNLQKFVIQHKLVPESKKCPKCDSDLKITKDYRFRCDRVRKESLYGGRKKVSRRCRNYLSALKGTFFEHSHLSIIKIIELSSWFLYNKQSQREVASELDVSIRTVSDWFSFCREVVEFYIL